MAKFEGRGKCACCEQAGKTSMVDVYSDKNGLAYYNCGPCRVRIVHRDRRASEALLARIDRHAEEDGAAPPAPAPLPVKPAAAPPAPKPVQTPPPAPKAGGFLSNFTLS
jgi:hypothetical protein